MSFRKYNREFDAYLFDLDDTLYLERDFVFSGYRAVAESVRKSHGADILERLQERFLRGERGDLFSPSLRDAGLDFPEAEVKRLVEVYRAHQPAIRLFQDSVRILSELKARGKKLGLISDGWHRVQENKVSALGLRAYFDSVVLTDEIGGRESWKPNPVGYQRCLGELDISPERAVYIADNPAKDFVVPRSLGMGSIRLIVEGGEHASAEAKERQFAAEETIRSLAELVD